MYYNMGTYTFDGGNKRVTYYTKNDAGEFTEVNTDDMFKERHERWVKNESAKIQVTAARCLTAPNYSTTASYQHKNYAPTSKANR